MRSSAVALTLFCAASAACAPAAERSASVPVAELRAGAPGQPVPSPGEARPAPWLVGGHTSSCILDRDRRVLCWGTFGAPEKPMTRWVEPQPLEGFSGVLSFDNGVDGACALTESGSVKCTPGIAAPSVPPGARRIAVGGGHACVLMEDGRVLCWGRGKEGQCGAPAIDELESPRAVEGLGHATAISLGILHSCAIVGDGEVACWGHNEEGELGDGTTRSRAQPQPVRGLEEVIHLTTRKVHTCALRRDGTVRCWGLGDDGQLGDGVARAVDGMSTSPVEVVGLDDVDDLSAGGAHTCALRKGEVYCWGSNQVGQTGSGSAMKDLRPVRVPDLDGVTAIAAGGGHQCAAKEDGSVWCWGNSFFGQSAPLVGGNARSPQLVLRR